MLLIGPPRRPGQSIPGCALARTRLEGRDATHFAGLPPKRVLGLSLRAGVLRAEPPPAKGGSGGEGEKPRG